MFYKFQQMIPLRLDARNIFTIANKGLEHGSTLKRTGAFGFMKRIALDATTNSIF